ncbi:hypothetical protein B0H14DRAFT_3447049 [Mycena olivaceomarginata]|nr:hypothetical protein B0H14DRAFT_3459319 [Mycena olivaceomarginata]KAJ7858842.1 hypothetical protein B0H14DRAFT_3447049 [Mycena olivaceomarginata]
MAAVVVGGRDCALRGMRKVRADACTLPAACFSVEHGVRDGGHAEHRCGTDPIPPTSSHPSTSSGVHLAPLSAVVSASAFHPSSRHGLPTADTGRNIHPSNSSFRSGSTEHETNGFA